MKSAKQSTLFITTTHYKDHSIITTSDKIPNCVSLCAMLFYFRYNDRTVSSNPNTTSAFSDHSSRSNTRVFCVGPRNFEPQTHEEDNTRAGIPSPSFRTVEHVTHDARFSPCLCPPCIYVRRVCGQALQGPLDHIHGGPSMESGFEPGAPGPEAGTLPLGHRGRSRRESGLKEIDLYATKKGVPFPPDFLLRILKVLKGKC
ncbi:hypothetical protein AVEN_55503-1 [Araneus ventricosus]|uniref:Uncharacterized protein n=1 Tax=Araneus ventricosus TaxID=182803 RepID=A0A4Y2C9J0_ARAVE|nr:hypothetical protein AVEN_55503-1 [Araneus ventricosus]